jgi:hypothetical protein
MEATMTCPAKHTRYQPATEEFVCPWCGKSAPDGLCIDNPAEGAASDCELLHCDDEMLCYHCRHATSGRAFAARLTKQAGLVPCPHCKGKGLVRP